MPTHGVTRSASKRTGANLAASCELAGRGLRGYAAEIASGLSVLSWPLTVRRARIAIGLAHADAGVIRPDRERSIRMLERGMGRVYGTREMNATPLVVESLERIVSTLGTTARDDRDRALLLLGFAGAFRSSELVAMCLEHIEWTENGMTVFIGRSKKTRSPPDTRWRSVARRTRSCVLCKLSGVGSRG
jgi:integrase